MRRVLSLFAGIEGFGLGLESTGGFEVTHAVELADYQRQVLVKRFPQVDLAVDVREVSGTFPVDGIVGGFPCQDLSPAGRGAGLDGARSGLWSEFARIIGEVEPEWVLIENVPTLRSRGLCRVLADLTGLGYSVEWDCLPAAAFGAWHLRDRVWIVAHRLGEPCIFGEPIEAVCRAPQLTKTQWRSWPRAGFAVHSEGCVSLEPLALLRDVKAGRLLLPSPTSSDGTGGRVYRPDFCDIGGRKSDGSKAQVTLGHYVAQIERGLWPTPTRSDGTGGPGRSDARTGGDNLRTAVVLWPTPHGFGKPEYQRRQGPSGNELGRAVNRAGGASKGSLNPDGVEWLMGFPVGWTDLDCDEPEHRSWLVEPADVPRVAEAVRRRRERLEAIGNALVPPAAAWLGGRVLTALEAARKEVAA